MAELVICRPVTAEALVRSQASPCGICGRQSDTVTVFLFVLLFAAVSVI